MISTDASGQGSCIYGKTRNHVLEIAAVLLDGTVWRSRPLDDAQLAKVKGREDRVGQVHRLIDGIDQEHGDLISRQVSEAQPLFDRVRFGPYSRRT